MTEDKKLNQEFEARFHNWRISQPRTQEDYFTKSNAQRYDQAFRGMRNFCMAPSCGYPLRDLNNFRVAFVGDVCGLCYDMYTAIYGRIHFAKAQREDNEAKKRQWPPEGRHG
jgi:hypothetical protein